MTEYLTFYQIKGEYNMVEYKGRCMRCKQNDMLMKDEEVVTMGGNKRAARGVCAKCGCKMYKILPKA